MSTTSAEDATSTTQASDTGAGSAGEPKRLLLIDGHAMAFRAFFALPADSFTDGRGQATNAVYGFARMIYNIVQSEQPTHVAVAFDLPGGTFRDRIYDQYKAGREKTPPEFIGQVGLIQQMLDALGVSWLTVEDFEADDIIASLSTRASGEGSEVLIVSSDRDALQLVGEDVTLLQPVKGVTEMRRMDPAAVEEKYAVTPDQYPDLAALVGESADNLPGVPGVGPKTAAKWIAQYGSLEGILAHADEIKGKAGQSLRDHREAVERNRRMNAAVRDLELPADDRYVLGRGDRTAVMGIFDDLAFGPTIRRDLPEVLLAQSGDAPAEELEDEGSRLDPSQIRRLAGAELVAALESGFADGAALAVDGSWELGEADAVLVALATDDAWAVIDPTALDEASEQALAAWLKDPAIPKTAYDTKATAHRLSGRGWTVEGWRTDLSIAEFLCRPDVRATDLAGLAMRHLQEDIGTESASAQQTLDLEDDSDAEGERWARAADAVRRLEPVLRSEMESHRVTLLHDELDLPLAEVLGGMERAGIAVSDEVLADLDEQHESQQTAVAESAFSHIGGDRINLGSPKQLQEVLFERLGMPKTRRTKTGFTTNAEALEELYAKTEHPFLADLLAHRDVTKMRQIIETLRRSIAPDGRIHTTFHQNIAATGRLSSNNPNLQNIPMRTEEGRRIRSAFHVSDGFETLLTADYSQIEMRIMAHLSEDEGLIEAFRSGEDLHSFVASRVFDVSPDEVDVAMRSKTKAVSYGLAYGLSVYGLSRQLGISQAEANALRDGYFERFGGVRDFLRHSVDKAREIGYTETIMGRRRYLPDLTSDNRQRRENAERVALNSPIQGSAADLMKLAMLRVDEGLREAGVRSQILLQVHDELVVEVAPGELDTVRDIVVEGMRDAQELSVPLEVGVGVGPNWLEASH